MKEFRDRVAVVTGAASGIGRGLSERFAGEGMKVVLADVEEDALRQAEVELREKGFDVLGVRTDVSKQQDVEKLAQLTLDAFGAVHIVCNNAGVGAGAGTLWECTLKDWEWVLGVNLWGVIHGVRVFLPIMIAQDTEGHMVNTGSVAGLFGNAGIYGVTKHGVVSLTESLYQELHLAGSKVKVSVLCPGAVNTRIMDAARNRPKDLTNAVEPPPDPRREAFAEAVRTMIKSGMDPAAVADQVLEGIREERLYVLTHTDFDGMIRTRFENILARQNPAPRMLA